MYNELKIKSSLIIRAKGIAMKKIIGMIGIVVVMMLLVLCLVPKAEARTIGLLVGPSLNLEGLNDVLGVLNKELGADFSLKEGLMYSLVLKGDWVTPVWRKGIDFSVCQAKAEDTIMGSWVGNQREKIGIEIGVLIMPIFFTRTYEPKGKGKISTRLGLGLGGVVTLVNISQEKTTFFWDQDGNLQETKQSSSKSLILPSFGVQLSAGLEYRLGKNDGEYDWSRKRKSILLEVRYISSTIEIRDPEAKPNPMEISVEMSEFSLRMGFITEF